MAGSISPVASGENALSAERVEPRLAAILAADVTGYSCLIAVDYDRTQSRLMELLGYVE